MTDKIRKQLCDLGNGGNIPTVQVIDSSGSGSFLVKMFRYRIKDYRSILRAESKALAYVCEQEQK